MTTTQTSASGAPAPGGPPPAGRPAARRPGLSPRRLLVNGGPLIALVVLVVVFAVLSPAFISGANVRTLLTQMSVLLVIGTGLTFVIILGGIDLSVEGVMATASLTFVLLAANDHNSLDLGPFAVVGGILSGTVFGLVNGLLHVKLRIPSFMVTLGTGAVGLGVASVLFGGRAPELRDDALRTFGVGSFLGISNLVFIAVVVLAAGFLIQRFTRVGRYGYAVGGDELVAKLSGIDIDRYKVWAFVLCGTTSGIAGVMAAMRLGVGDTTSSSGNLFTAITAVVVGGTLLIGGRGGVLRTLVGVAIVVVLSNGLILVGVSPYVQTAVQGLVIVVAVISSGWSLRNRTRVVK